MDLVTINPTTKQPEKLIEKYDSLVWAERFNGKVGDFQITTGDTARFMSLLPKGRLVTLLESNVPMIVETHKIERKKNKPEVLTIQGRAFESILDRRASVQNLLGGAPNWSIVAKTPSDVAHYTIVKVCVEGIADVNDIFPPAEVEFLTPDDYLNTSGPNRLFAIPRGNLLTTVMNLIQTESVGDPTTIPATPPVVQHGIRSIRPNANGSAIAIEIYRGTDRSNQIVFDGTRDLLDDGSYLFSDVGSANTAYIIGPNTGVKLNGRSAPLSGLERRVILFDATSSGVMDPGPLTEAGKSALSAAHPISMFDGSINQDLSEYVYGKDYFLGDTVKLVGDYGLTEKARVAEYIRSEDATGSKSYPTLVTVGGEE